MIDPICPLFCSYPESFYMLGMAFVISIVTVLGITHHQKEWSFKEFKKVKNK